MPLVRSVAILAAHHSLLPVRTKAARSRCFGMERGWSWLDGSHGLAMNFLSLVHALVVGCELVLANEAVAFSVVLASHHRAGEFGGVVAVLGAGVAVEVRPTL